MAESPSFPHLPTFSSSAPAPAFIFGFLAPMFTETSAGSGKLLKAPLQCSSANASHLSTGACQRTSGLPVSLQPRSHQPQFSFQNDSKRSQPSSGLALEYPLSVCVYLLHLFAVIIIFWSKESCRKFRWQYYLFYSIEARPTGSFLSSADGGIVFEVSLTWNSLLFLLPIESQLPQNHWIETSMSQSKLSPKW